MTTKDVEELTGLTKTGLASMCQRHKLGKLRVGKDGRTHRHLTQEDVDFILTRIGKRGRPSKEPNVARNEEPIENGTSLGQEKTSGSRIQGVLRPGDASTPQTFP